jgi:hypothetical protein
MLAGERLRVVLFAGLRDNLPRLGALFVIDPRA